MPKGVGYKKSKANLASNNTTFNRSGGNRFLNPGRSGTRKPGGLRSPGLPTGSRLGRAGGRRAPRLPVLDAGFGGTKARKVYRKNRRRV